MPVEPIPSGVWRRAAVIVLGAFMSALTITIYNPADRVLASALHARESDTEWVAIAYLLGYAAVIPLASWATRRFGAVRTWLFSLLLFTLLSALTAVATSLPWLIAARAALGIAGGLLVPAGQVALAHEAGPTRMGRIISVTGIPVVLAPMLGPVIGGLLIEQLSWQWLGLINVPIALVGLVLGWFMLDRDKSTARPRLDVTDLCIIAAGLPSIVYGLIAISETDAATQHIGWIFTGIGALLLIVFTIRTLRSKEPLLDLRLLTKPAFSAGAIASFALGAGLFGPLAILPTYFMDVRAGTPVFTGLMIATQGIGAVIATPLAGKWSDKYGSGVVVILGLLIAAVSTIPLALLGTGTSYWWIGTVLAVRGLGIGFSTTPIMSAVYKVLAKSEIPHASPLLNMIQRVGGSAGIAFLTIIVTQQAAAVTLINAVDTAFWWVTGFTVLTLIPAYLLRRAEHAAVARID